MTESVLFFVRNETPLVVNYSTGNYFKSLNYIPASSILGSVKVTMIERWGSGEPAPQLDLVVSDAYPSEESQRWLNPPSLVTLYKEKEGDSYYVDGLRDILDTLEGRTKWGEKNMRLKKGPSTWYYRNGRAYPVQVSHLSYTILKLDGSTRTPLRRERDGEIEGYMAHVEALGTTTFSFVASGSQVDELRKALSEGVYVGSFKTKGYGLIKLVKTETFRENEASGMCVLDFYGNVSHEDYERLRQTAEHVLFESVGFERRKRLDYNRWIIDHVVRSGSVMVVSDCGKVKGVVEEINGKSGGRIVVNHPIHGLA